MRKFFYLIILIMEILWLVSCDTEKNIAPRFDKTFIKLYGGEYVNQAVDLLPLDDGGFAILGAIQTTPTNPYDILFIVTDSLGHIKFQKQIGDPVKSEQPVRLIHDSNGYVICGNILDDPKQRVFIYTISDSGDIIDSISTYERLVFTDMTESSDNSLLVFTGVYQDTTVTEFTVSRTDLSDSYQNSHFGKSSAPGYGAKVMDNNDIEPGTVKILMALNGNVDMRLWDLAKNDSYIKPDNIGDSLSIPVDFVRGNFISGNYIVLGYNNNQTVRFPDDPAPGPTIKGPFISEIKPSGELIANHFLSDTDHDYSGLQPTNIYKYMGSDYLLLGKEITQVPPSIRLLRLDKDFKVIADKSFGTGQNADDGVRLEVLPDNKVVFLATVNYFPARANTKIALFKLTPSLELDY